MNTRLVTTFLILAVASTIGYGQGVNGLWVDFNSTTQDDGPNRLSAFNGYDAGHEVTEDFVTQSFATSFPGLTDTFTIGVTPDWPNTTDNRVQQMIDRAANWDASWTDNSLDGITDFLGIDTRTGNGGNGDWDGATGTPTYMTLSLSGLPANTYDWTSFHHDTEHVHVDFQVEISTDGGASYAQLADGYVSDGSAGGNPDSATDGSPGLVTDFASLSAAGGVYRTSFMADGSNDVVFRFAPYSGAIAPAVHNQIWGINAFQLRGAVVPESSSPTLVWLASLVLLAFLRRR